MASKESIFDIATDKLLKRGEQVRGVLHAKFAHTRPYRTEEIKNDELLLYYIQMTDDVNSDKFLGALIQRHGEDTVNQYIMDMEQLKQKRGVQNARPE